MPIIGCSVVLSPASAGNLGVVFDNGLTFEKYISAICKLAFYHLRRIAKIWTELSVRGVYNSAYTCFYNLKFRQWECPFIRTTKIPDSEAAVYRTVPLVLLSVILTTTTTTTTTTFIYTFFYYERYILN